MARGRKPIEGNRHHEVLVGGADARALETAADGLRGENVTVRQAEAACDRLMDIAARYRMEDGKAARKK